MLRPSSPLPPSTTMTSASGAPARSALSVAAIDACSLSIGTMIDKPGRLNSFTPSCPSFGLRQWRVDQDRALAGMAHSLDQYPPAAHFELSLLEQGDRARIDT